MNASADRDDFPRRLERLLRLDFQRDIPGMAKEALAAQKKKEKNEKNKVETNIS